MDFVGEVFGCKCNFLILVCTIISNCLKCLSSTCVSGKEVIYVMRVFGFYTQQFYKPSWNNWRP